MHYFSTGQQRNDALAPEADDTIGSWIDEPCVMCSDGGAGDEVTLMTTYRVRDRGDRPRGTGSRYRGARSRLSPRRPRSSLFNNEGMDVLETFGTIMKAQRGCPCRFLMNL